MSEGPILDAAVVGGGISGCSTALHLARGGMRVAVLERGRLAREASSANAGTLSMQIKRASLVGHSMRAWEMWRTARQWLGADVGFVHQGGLTVAYAEDEVEMLETRMRERRDAGAPIEFMDAKRAQAIEPGLSDRPRRVTYCPMDAFADPLKAAHAFRLALAREGVDVREATPVHGIERDGTGFAVQIGSGAVRARRVVLTGGAWLGRMLAWFGLEVPVEYGPHMVSVTERMTPVMRTVVMVASGTLTVKQNPSGTVLIGGGWEGIGDPDRGGVTIIPENFIGNLRVAYHTLPGLARARITRSWIGIDANVPDFMPLAGPVPGVEGAFVLGCIRGGFTNGPLFGHLMAQLILGREPDLPLFDPARCAAPSQPLRAAAS